MANKKIIFFLPTLSVGGGERVASELSLSLPSSIDPIIVLFKNQVSYPYRGRLICLNIPISLNFIYRIFFFFVAVSRFKRVVREENPDYIVSFGMPANIINVLSSRKAILRIDNFMSSSAKGIYKILIRFLFNKAPKIVCVSKAAAKDLVDNFSIKQEKIKVIYNPLNIEDIKKMAFCSLSPEHQKIFLNPVIINVGRMTKQKSQRYLIDAFAMAKKEVKDAQLVILGTGELKSKLEQQIKNAGLQDSVHFLGWQNNPFKFLAKSRAFVLSSLWEGLPYVLLEAMACGLPVISFDCKSGPREILAPKTDIGIEAKHVEYEEFGILVPPKSSDDLAKALIEVLKDKNLAIRLAEKSRQRAQDFDVKNIIREWDFLL